MKSPKPLPREKKPRDRRRVWLIVLLSIYAALLVWLVLFKLGFQIPHRPRGFNFIPFYTESLAGLVWDVALNILAFLPLGIYLKMLGLSLPKTTLVGAAVGLSFELIQFSFAMGRADITDLLTNTLGATLGAGLYILFRRLFKAPEKLDRLLLWLATAVSCLALAYFALELLTTLLVSGTVAA